MVQRAIHLIFPNILDLVPFVLIHSQCKNKQNDWCRKSAQASFNLHKRCWLGSAWLNIH